MQAIANRHTAKRKRNGFHDGSGRPQRNPQKMMAGTKPGHLDLDPAERNPPALVL